MPYIPQERRKVLKADPSQAATPGELNYVLTLEFCRRWNAAPCYATAHEIRRQRDHIFAGPCFPSTGKWNLGDLDAAFELAYMEFYRMVVATYEDRKREENGCVYTEEGVTFR